MKKLIDLCGKKLIEDLLKNEKDKHHRNLYKKDSRIERDKLLKTQLGINLLFTIAKKEGLL